MSTTEINWHTPGPWTARRSIPGHLFEVLDSDSNLVMRIRGGMVPTLFDARLIAAAPEMLSALRAVAAWLSEVYGTDSENMQDAAEFAREIRAAIAKATS